MRAAILTLILFMILPAANVLAAVPVSERAALVALYWKSLDAVSAVERQVQGGHGATAR